MTMAFLGGVCLRRGSWIGAGRESSQGFSVSSPQVYPGLPQQGRLVVPRRLRMPEEGRDELAGQVGRLSRERWSMMSSLPLTSKQRAQLRSIAGRREMAKELMTLMVGENGVTAAVVAELDTSLRTHELVKVKLKVAKKKEAKEIGGNLVEQVHAGLVNVIGHCVILYRPREDKPHIALLPAEEDEHK